MNIDERDLKNLLRHAFLFGCNSGHLREFEEEYGSDTWVTERDTDLDGLIQEFKERKYMDYNTDPGSHNCTEDCL